MKKLILIFSILLLTSCGLFQSTGSSIAYLKTVYPNSVIIEDSIIALCYTVVDTTSCNVYRVEMSAWKKNKILSENVIINNNE